MYVREMFVSVIRSDLRLVLPFDFGLFVHSNILA